MGLRTRRQTVPALRHADFADASGPARAIDILVPALPVSERGRAGARHWFRAAEERRTRRPDAINAPVSLQDFPINIHPRTSIELELERRCSEVEDVRES